jgi:cobalt/nickel transport system ATP-binding protein
MISAVEVQNLHFHYSTSKGSLHHLSFRISEGECVAIVGPNGAGKSTLLLHLNGLLPESLDQAGHQGGEIRIFGRVISAKTVRDIRREVGLLFQDPDDQLFCPTVFDDIAFGPRQFGLEQAHLIKRVADALAAVGLDGFEERTQMTATRIIATHDLEMVLDLCPRTIVLDGGKLVADGPTLDLLGNETLMIEHGLEVPSSLRRNRDRIPD